MNYTAKSLYDLIKLDIPDGVHTYTCVRNNISLNFEIVNYKDDVNFTTTPTLGNNTADSQMLILKFHKNLTIGAGVKITPQVRKKGMTIFCYGTITNYGIISMTARGANATGQDLYLYKDEMVPAIGAPGLPSVVSNNATNGNNGTGRQTGSGGRGRSISEQSYYLYTGSSSAGTSYRGGAGTGGGFAGGYGSKYFTPDNSGKDNGNGGNSSIITGFTYQIICTGGAGISSGTNSVYAVSGYSIKSNGVGCGGLLNIFAKELINENVIESIGTPAIEISSSGFDSYKTTKFISGSSSGGGSINIFADKITKNGTVSAAGGRVPNQSTVNASSTYYGGAGGNGSVTIQTVNVNSYSEILFNDIKDEINSNELVKKTTISFS